MVIKFLGILWFALSLLSCSSALPIHPSNQGGSGSVFLGGAFRLNDVTQINDLAQSPDAFTNKTIRTQGVIDSVCRDNGCWIDIRPLSTTSFKVLVNPLNKVFYFPVDCRGKMAEVEGRYFIQSYPVERMLHWQHHGWREEQNFQKPLSIYRIEATSALIQ